MNSAALHNAGSFVIKLEALGRGALVNTTNVCLGRACLNISTVLELDGAGRRGSVGISEARRAKHGGG